MMKNYSFFLFTGVLLISSCSSWKPSEHSARTNSMPARSVASTAGLSCNGLMDQFLFRPVQFSEASFSHHLNDMGYGYVMHGVRDLAKRSDNPFVYREIASKMEDHARRGVDMRVLIDELDPQEQRALWNGLIRPQIFEVEEQMLALQAQQGDELARFLLSVPQGVQRDNAESAAVLMKKIDPSLDNQAIVARLYRELGTCLTK
jgi:hypothetical protein